MLEPLISPSSDSISLSVVVSHCDNPVDWIADYIGLGNQGNDISLPSKTKLRNVILNDVTIFSKCGKQVDGAIPGANVVRMPNVGRCDHSYASWMLNATRAQHGNRGLTEEGQNSVVLFMKDNAYRARAYNYRSLANMLDIVQGSGFACIEPPTMAEGITSSAYHNLKAMGMFSMNNYDGADPRMIEKYKNLVSRHEEPFLVSKFSTFEKWSEAMGLQGPLLRSSIMFSRSSDTFPLIPVCYGGIFGTSLAQIRMNSATLYSNIAVSLSRANNILEGHFAERSWAAMLSRPPHPSLLSGEDFLGAESDTRLRSVGVPFEDLFASGTIRDIRRDESNGWTCFVEIFDGKCGILLMQLSNLEKQRRERGGKDPRKTTECTSCFSRS